MATLGTYNRVTISGTLTSSEVWSTSLAFADVTGPTSTSLDGQSTLSSTAEQIWIDLNDAGAAKNPFSAISSSGAISTVRVENRDATSLLQVAEYSDGTVLEGVGSPTQPPSVAIVVSLLTGIPGRRYRGRMYLPVLTGSIGLDLRIPSSTVAAFLDNMGDRVTAWTAAFTGGAGSITPVVVSLAGGVCTEVQQLRIGNVYDTQRRRRDDLIEEYQTLTLP